MGVLQDMWKRRKLPSWMKLPEFCVWLGIEAEDADAESVDWLLGLDPPAGLALEGGYTRFPGAEIQDHCAHWKTLEDSSEHYLRRGELFQGVGSTFFRASISALMTAYELGTLRRRQDGMGVSS